MWFIDVVLVNPQTGDLIKKRLDFQLEVGGNAAESWAKLAAASFERALPTMMERAKSLKKLPV
jgi:hypothetical protein